jgi:hypothetical protein
VPQAAVHIRGGRELEQAHPGLDTGETLAVFNIHLGYAYTLILLRLNGASSSSSSSLPQPPVMQSLGVVQAGDVLNVVIGEPGEYQLTALESAFVTMRISVRYNKKLDARTGRCAYPSEEPAPITTAVAAHHQQQQQQQPCDVPISTTSQLQSLVLFMITTAGCVTLMVVALSAVIVAIINKSRSNRPAHEMMM